MRKTLVYPQVHIFIIANVNLERERESPVRVVCSPDPSPLVSTVRTAATWEMRSPATAGHQGLG
jgi:hypothetical protein